ncbi:uncharacterized protein A4U43_C10F13640, partial [Asparagus officinalis]
MATYRGNISPVPDSRFWEKTGLDLVIHLELRKKTSRPKKKRRKVHMSYRIKIKLGVEDNVHGPPPQSLVPQSHDPPSQSPVPQSHAS